VGLSVALDFGFEIGHSLAASHQVGDLLSGFLPLGEISGFGAVNQHREVVTDSERMDDVGVMKITAMLLLRVCSTIRSTCAAIGSSRINN
jgi:hypothetical protein